MIGRLTVALATALTAVLVPPAAHAAVTSCSANADGIYGPPATVTSAPGTLLACRSVSLSQVPNGYLAKAWQVQYASTDRDGRKVAVSGTVAVPILPWFGPGPRPIVAFNPGTLGLGPQCAFSKQLAGAYQDEYEGGQIAAFLQAGFAVAATDGLGYLNGQVHPYVVGQDAGHALLDIARTTSKVPGGGVSGSAPVVIDGYSEGGQAALWAAQLAGTYARELRVVGAAAGGVPGDLKVVAPQLNGGPFAGFLADAVVGVIAAHPSFPVNRYINDEGRRALAKAKTVCLTGTLANFAGARVENYTTDHLSLNQLYGIADPSGYTVGRFLDASKLGVGIAGKIGFPVFQYRGLLEEVIATATEDATAAAYCRAGVRTLYKSTYLGDHLLTDGQATSDVVKYLTDRVNGKPAPSSC